jgi:hypothetical protein
VHDHLAAVAMLLPLFTLLLCYALFRLTLFLYRELSTSLSVRRIPGPKNPSFIYGNFNEMAVRVECVISKSHLNQFQASQWTMDEWREKFGRNFQFKALFNVGFLHSRLKCR